MRVYLDNCCYNRPFDSQTQLRVRLETEAKLAIQALMRAGALEYAWSDILVMEPMDYAKWRERNMYLDEDLDALAERARRTGARFMASRMGA